METVSDGGHDDAAKGADKPGRNKEGWSNEETFWTKVKEDGFRVPLQDQTGISGRWSRAIDPKKVALVRAHV